MATYLWSERIDGENLTFDPAADVLHFDIPTLRAPDVAFTFTDTSTTFSVGGKSVTVDGLAIRQIVASPAAGPNVIFPAPSRLMVGDNNVLTANDDGPNTLPGDAGSDRLIGLGGNDTLRGAGSNDLLEGGAGNDLLDGGAGTDTASYADAAAGVRVSLALTVAQNTAGAGIDTVVNVENLVGSDLADVLTGSAAANVLRGGGGNDTLDGGAGADTLIGGPGDDTYRVDNLLDRLVEESGEGVADQAEIRATAAGSYRLSDHVENARIFSTAAINLAGNDGDNAITANAAANVLEGGAGNDTLDGGLGTDTASYAGAVAGVTVDLSQAGVSQDTVGAGTDTLIALENLTGSGFDDLLSGNASPNVIEGGAGNDTLDGGGGADTLRGGAGDDTYVVDLVRTTAVLLQDTVTENAGAGHDTLQVRVAGTLALATPFTLVLGANLEDVAVEGTAAQRINVTGNALDNGITGNDAANLLDGGAGTDTLAGGLGNDTYTVDSLLDVIVEDLNAGTDVVQLNLAAAGTYLLEANVENALAGGAAAVNVTGNGLNNQITGNGAANLLLGGAGNDTLDGGLGADTASYAGAAAAVTVSLALATPQDTGGAGSDLLRNLENLTGSAGNDTLTGSAGANVLEGGDGNDVISGGLGVDTASYAGAAGGVSVDLRSTSEQDTLGAGLDTLTGIENLIGSAHDDSFIGTAGANSIDGGAGSDTLSYAGAAAAITVNLALTTAQATGGGGSDTLRNLENLVGGSSNDRLTGSAVANRLEGGAGNDTLDGGAGADTLDGGGGSDNYTVDNPGDLVVEAADAGVDLVRVNLAAAGTYLLEANVENALVGGTAAVGVLGNDLNNAITGNGAANLLLGGSGNDTLDGGAGVDTASYAGAAGVTVSLALGTLQATGGAGGDILRNVENLIGSDGNDSLTGNAGANVLEGGLGDDTLDGGAGLDTASYAGLVAGVQVDLALSGAQDTLGAGIDTLRGIENLTGSGGNDTLTGGAGANAIDGGAGDDFLYGGAGADTLRGGEGADTYVLDLVRTSAGVGLEDAGIETANSDGDTLLLKVAPTLVLSTPFALGMGTAVENAVVEGTAAQRINVTGNARDNVITGNAAANVLDGGAGKDTLTGGLGDDTYVLDDPDDEVIEVAGGGTDTVQLRPSLAEAFVLDDNVENALARGTGAVDLIGNDSNNILTGNAGANRIEGGAGNDTLDGGLGVDTASYAGAAAAVAVSLALATPQVTLGAGTDVLRNFENLIGSAGNDTLTGNGGANVLEGGAGDDRLDGAAGTDTASYAGAASGVTVDLRLAIQQDTLGAGLDTLIGIENLIGSAGDDSFIGTPGANLFDGGAGIDTVSYAAAAAAVTVNLALATAQATGGGGGDTLRNIENLVGTTFNDTLAGGAGINELTGGAGNDTYGVNDAGDRVVEEAGGGTDLVRINLAAAGTYQIADHVENALVAGTAAVDVTGNELNNQITGNGAANLLFGGLGNDTLDGGLGIDTASYAGSAAVTVSLAVTTVQDTLGAGTDVLRNIENLIGSDGNDTLIGSGVPNLLEGGLGDDTLDGGLGTNTASYAGAPAGVTVDLDVVGPQDTGGAGIDTLVRFQNLVGSSGNDSLAGTSGDNVIDGGSGAGNDTLDGRGSLNDTVSYASASAAVLVSLATVTAQNTLGAGTDTLTAFENLTGSAFDDELTGDGQANVLTGGAGSDILDGGAGIDTLRGGAGDDLYRVDLVKPAATVVVQDTVTESLNEGHDTLVLRVDAGLVVATPFTLVLGANLEDAQVGGTAIQPVNVTGNALNNALTGSAAANLLDGGAGSDTLTGGAGDDIYVLDRTSDQVVEGAAEGDADTVRLQLPVNTTYTLPANVERAEVLGTNAINVIGTDVANRITGNAATNRLEGRGGDDLLEGGAGNDTIDGGAGTDTASYAGSTAAVSVSLAVTAAQNTVGAGTDTLANMENLTGSAFADTLTGNAGSNVIDGGAGADTLTGGAGADFFRFGARGAADTIADFVSGSDRFLFSQAAIRIGDGDNNVENAVIDAGAGFSPLSELVIVRDFSAIVSDPFNVEFSIGAASASYAAGATVLFAVDNGLATGIFLFTSSGIDSFVSAEELTLLGVSTASGVTALADYAFVA